MMNEWRLSGGAGIVLPLDPNQETITQGIGFPQRPIEGVPLKNTPVDNSQVAQGAFMQFMSQGWEQGKVYPEGATLTNGIFTMVANTPTLDDPFPKPDGNPTFTLPTFTPTNEVNTSVIYSGLVWTFTENVLAKSFRIWVPTISINSNYRMVVVTTYPGADPSTQVIEEPVLTAGQWTVIALLNQLVPIGTTVLVFIDAFESSGGIPLVSVWTRENDGISAPPVGSFRTSAGRDQFLIDKTDSNGLDRSASLSTIGLNATIAITEQGTASRSEAFRTDSAAQDMGSYFLFDVTKTGQGAGGEPRSGRSTNCAFDTPTVISTGYTEELTGLANPAWATVAPFLQFDGVDQSPASDTAFGVDIEAEITEFSEDWNVFSFNG